MKFLLPKNIGFCRGVQSAIDKALQVQGEAYCLGDIVHNKSVIESLQKRGIKTVQNVCDVPQGATLIIRAHGVPPIVYEQAKTRNLTVVDATCPSVRAIQQKAQKYYNNGYQIVLVGDATHPEIIGINGWCNNSALIFDGKSILDIKGHEKVLVMFQTTFDTRFFEKSLKNILTDGVKTLEIFNTICYTTTEKQYYAQILSKQSQLAIVVGDANSSNTRRLFEIASQNCKTILTDGDVSEIAFDNNTRNVCFISGASTPEELVKGVFKRMTEIANDAVSVETVVTDQKVMSKDEEMLAKAVNDMKEGHKYRPGNKVKCLVVQVSDDGVYVSIPSSKRNAFIPNAELALDGDYEAVKSTLVVDETTLECLIISVDKGITLSKKAIDERYKDDALVEGIKNGDIFEVKMTRVGKECLTGKLGSYTVIVHASQIKIGYVKNLETYLNKTLRLVVSGPDKVDDAKRVIFASQKAILLAEKKAKEDEFWNNIAVNEIVEGKVLRFAPFGAFVDVRGFDCLAHTSDLSWDRVNNPQDVLTIGETYEFVVLALDREKNRVSLGYKQLQPQPWQVAEEKYAVGSVVTGTVARVVPFGAFIQLDKSIDGLLHVSNVSWEWIEDINQVLKVGDEVQVEVLEFDGERKRITLSRKSLLPKPEQANVATETPDEE